MKLRNWLLLAAGLALLSACGTSAEDERATQTAAIAASETRKANYFATQTAAPTATSVPTSTPASGLPSVLFPPPSTPLHDQLRGHSPPGGYPRSGIAPFSTGDARAHCPLFWVKSRE